MASRTATTHEQIQALVGRELPELQLAGSWLLVSKRLPLRAASGVMTMFIDLHRGTCLSLELLVAPLGSTIGAWLNSALPAPGTLSRIYFDGNKTIHQGALVAWGAAHGLPVIIHPGCEATDSVSTLMGSLMNAINGSTSISLDELRNVLEDWRMRYNAQLGRDD